LLEWTVGIEAGGALLSLVSFGAAEGGAQGVEAARVAVTAGRVGKIIQTLIDLAGTLTRAVTSVFSKIGKVAQRLLRIERTEVSEGTVTAAAMTPEVAERYGGCGGRWADEGRRGVFERDCAARFDS
jgi:hypothetical protein